MAEIDPIVDKHHMALNRIGRQLDDLCAIATAFSETGNDFMWQRLACMARLIRNDVRVLSDTFTETYCVTKPEQAVMDLRQLNPLLRKIAHARFSTRSWPVEFSHSEIMNARTLLAEDPETDSEVGGLPER